MDQMQLLLALMLAAAVGLLALITTVRRQRRDKVVLESPFAASTEGEKRCPRCGMGNLWTERQCSACGGPLAG